MGWFVNKNGVVSGCGPMYHWNGELLPGVTCRDCGKIGPLHGVEYGCPYCGIIRKECRDEKTIQDEPKEKP